MAFRRVNRAPLLASTMLVLLAVPGPVRAEPIPWDQADQHVGEETTVVGRVLGIKCTQLSCLLAFDPAMAHFTTVVQAELFKELPPEKLEQFNGKQVAVHGKIALNGKRPEIAVASAQDIQFSIAERKRDRDEERARRAKAQGELLERVEAVLDRLADVTERMASVQERMDALLTELEQRNAALASQLASQAPPPQPVYGPPPRPAYEALRSIKRGMARDEILRLVGQPIDVEEAAGGWTTWYYGPGRSVTFDARGRVQSFIGFPGT